MTSDVCRNHLHYEIIRSFLEWSSQISRFTTSTLHLRKSLEDGSRSIQSMVDSMIKIDMKNARAGTVVKSSCYSGRNEAVGCMLSKITGSLSNGA